MTSGGVRGFSALYLLLYFEWLPSDHCFTLLAIMLVSVLDHSILSHYFGRDASSRISRFVVLTFCAELLYLSLLMHLVRRVSFK